MDALRPRSTVNDMYHDVGMYRGKTFDDTVDNLVGMLDTCQIRGMTSKGAQVSANAGPTNWYQSALTIRIKQSPDEVPGLGPDTNSPVYAKWYGTMARGTAIPFERHNVEVLVNGSTRDEVQSRTEHTRAALQSAGIDVPVRPIDQFLDTRFHEMADHLPPEDRAQFVAGMQQSPLWAQKAVGDLAARKGDAGLAEFRHTGVPEAILQARDQLAEMLGDRAHLADTFIQDVCGLSEAEQIVLADRFRTPYTHAVACVADGYDTGHGLDIALEHARRAT